MGLPSDDLIKEKLTDLQALLRLEHTPNGKDELQRRIRLLGKCTPADGESDRQFYGKLRHWLDQSL